MSISSATQPQKIMSEGFQRTTSHLAVFALVLSSFIPPALVILDRWFGNQQIANSLVRWWCVTEFLCRSAWRPYFLIVFLCTIMVIILISVIGAERIDKLEDMLMASDVPMENHIQSRIGLVLLALGLFGVLITIVRLIARGGLVGWGYFLVCILYLTGCLLLTTPLGPVRQYLRSNWAVILAYAMGWTVVSWFLFSLFARQEISIFLIALVIVTASILYRVRRKLSPSYWLFLLSMIIFTLQLNAWYYSFIGDEYAFYGWAKVIAQEHSIVEIGNNLFNGTIVYAENPYVASLLQAASIKLFDKLNFGWRFASILASALSIPFFYSFFRTFLVRWVAFSATFFIAVSHYLISFSRIGYDNTQALLAMGMSLAAAAWVIRSNRRIAFLATGMALAFCFYVFPSAMYIPPIVFWLLLWYRPPWKRMAWLDWALLIFTALIPILPLFSQPQYWESKLHGFISLNSNQSLATVAQNILTQFAYAFYSFLYIINESHYVTVAYLDALTAALVLIGGSVIIRRIQKDKFARVILSGWLLLLLFVGASHQYPFPPNTRMMLLVPWWGMMAAIGLQWLAARLQTPWLARGAIIVLFIAILGLNLYQAYGVSVQHRIRNSNFESLFVRIGETLHSQSASFPQTITFVYDPSKHDVSLLRTILELEYLSVHVREVDITSLSLHDAETDLKAPDQVVVFSPFLDPSIHSSYQNLLNLDQQVKCQLDSGSVSIEVWYPGTAPSPCRELSYMSVRFPNPLDLVGLAILLIYLIRHQLWRMVTAIPVRLAQLREAWPLRVRFQYETVKPSRGTSNGNDSEMAFSPDAHLSEGPGVVIDLKVQVNVHPRNQIANREARATDSQNSNHTPQLPLSTSSMNAIIPPVTNLTVYRQDKKQE